MTAVLQSTIRRGEKFLDLPVGRQRRMLHALLLVIAMRIGLWVVPYRILQRIAGRVKPRRDASPGEIEHIVRNVTAASRYVWQATCLTQALTAQVLLRRDGFSPTLRLGVARDQHGTFKAHAWIELAGRIVIGDLGEEMIYSTLQHSRGR